jgi:hypothetical protein
MCCGVLAVFGVAGLLLRAAWCSVRGAEELLAARFEPALLSEDAAALKRTLLWHEASTSTAASVASLTKIRWCWLMAVVGG